MTSASQAAVSPLLMANTAAANVAQLARAQDEDPVRAHVAQVGRRGQDAAYFAACMALVSIANDLHALAVSLAPGQVRDDQ